MAGGHLFVGTVEGEVLDLLEGERDLEAELREELREETFEASAGNDKVTAVANGVPELAEIRIDPELLQQEDLEMVQDLVNRLENDAKVL